MPIHDWKRVPAGIFHDFHSTWIVELKRALNGGILPQGYYALAEQVAGKTNPDVLTLELTPKTKKPDGAPPSNQGSGGIALATFPPKVQFTAITEEDQYILKRKTVVIRHTSDDQVVALLEVLSPGNKSSRRELRRFVNKAASALRQGIQLLILDLFPPTPLDPQGIHGVIWGEFVSNLDFKLPPDKPLTLAAYTSNLEKRAYVQPVAKGETLPDMPLFLDSEEYVLTPLEATYQEAFSSLPQHLQQALEAK